MKPIKNKDTMLPTCPWCGYAHQNYFEYGQPGIYTCASCGKPFDLAVEAIPNFSTEKSESKWKVFTDRIYEKDAGKEYHNLDDFWDRCNDGYKMVLVLNEIGYDKPALMLALTEAVTGKMPDPIYDKAVRAVIDWAEMKPISKEEFMNIILDTISFTQKACDNKKEYADKALLVTLAVGTAYFIGTGEQVSLDSMVAINYFWSPRDSNVIANKLRERFQPKI